MDNISISINTTNTPHANKLEWACGTWDSLHKITARYEYSATRFENGTRKNSRAEEVSLIIFDFDEGIKLEEGIELFGSYKSLIVTTKSHQVEKHGVTADRFRVILYQTTSILDMNYYSKLMRVLTRYYKSDIACTDSARYYSPNPKQQVYYSDSVEIFDITRFDEQINSVDVDVKKHITHSRIKQEQPTKMVQHSFTRVDLSLFLDQRIEYYHYGMKTSDILRDLIDKTEVSDQAIGCHCFLNEEHEDKNPSCYIYHNENSIYAKCTSCQMDGMMYLERKIND